MDTGTVPGDSLGKYVLYVSVGFLFIGFAQILVLSETGSGVFYVGLAFLTLLIFYSRLSTIPGSGYEQYRESLDVAALIGLDLIFLILYLIHPNGVNLAIVIILICVTHLSLVMKIYRKHFPKIPASPLL